MSGASEVAFSEPNVIGFEQEQKDFIVWVYSSGRANAPEPVDLSGDICTRLGSEASGILGDSRDGGGMVRESGRFSFMELFRLLTGCTLSNSSVGKIWGKLGGRTLMCMRSCLPMITLPSMSGESRKGTSVVIFLKDTLRYAVPSYFIAVLDALEILIFSL